MQICMFLMIYNGITFLDSASISEQSTLSSFRLLYEIVKKRQLLTPLDFLQLRSQIFNYVTLIGRYSTYCIRYT